MRFQASKKDIRQGLKAIKRIAMQALNEDRIGDCIRHIRTFTDIAGQFNLDYYDPEMEDLLSTIAHRQLRREEEWTADEGRWVFYDDFCTTYVLGLQWLDALASSGKEILYITTRDMEKKRRHNNILDAVDKYSNVRCIVIPKGKFLDRAQKVLDEIADFKASKVILHKHPSLSLSNLVLPLLPASVNSYLINLSDQTFWLGSKAIDYCLEFRPFGASVSMQRRALKREQLLMVPFYPADDGNPFTGFPPECTDDKVVVFSGGDYYKTLDGHHVYWKLVKGLLDSFTQVVFLFATKNIPEGDAEIRRFITENHFEGRFIYIGFRPDIFQVFGHCDIYMGTCPASGSLMSQLAAIHAKPILQFYAPGTPDDETEQAICINDRFQISHCAENTFFEEAKRLIMDKLYRESQGKRLHDAMMRQDQFNSLTVRTIESNQTQIEIKDYPVDYTGLDDRWFYLERAGYRKSLGFLYSYLGPKVCLKYAPGIFVKKNLGRLCSTSSK